MEFTVLRFPDASAGLKSDHLRSGAFQIVTSFGATVAPVSQEPSFGPGAPLSGILGQTGDWWCLARDDRGRHIVLADPFGMQPLYMAQCSTPDGASLFVGASSTDLARAIRIAGGNLETNWASILTTISARHDLLDCVFDFESFTRGITMLPPDKAILIDGESFAVIDRPEPESWHGATYDQLVERGSERAIADFRNLVRTHDNVGVNLSGGKDSRVVLALAMAAGVESDISILANDPTPATASVAALETFRADLDISSRIVSQYGLRWADRRIPRDIWPDTLAGQLEVFQQYRRGLSHQFIPTGLSYRLRESDAKINGAGGEIYRKYWSEVLAKHPVWKGLGHSPESVERDAEAVFKALSSPLSMPEDLREEAAAKFATAVIYLDAGSFTHALDRHYEFFRLRGHAGGRRWGQHFGITNYSILLQPDFVRAVSLLDPAERFGGRILFDIVEKWVPDLHDLEYQSGPWEFSTGRPKVFDWSQIPPSPEHFRASQQRVKQSTTPSRYIGRPRPDMGGLIAAGLTDLSDAMQTDGLSPDIIRPLLQNPPTDLRGQGRLLSRLSTWQSGLAQPGSFAAIVRGQAPRVQTIHPARN